MAIWGKLCSKSFLIRAGIGSCGFLPVAGVHTLCKVLERREGSDLLVVFLL